MKIAAGLIVFNEEEYLKYCLKSFYNVVDKIIIVEGCDPSYDFLATPEGLSLDKTSVIIQNFPDTQHKIHYIRKGFMERQNMLRDTILDFVDPDTDLVFVPDADELYDPKELLNSFKFMNDYKIIHRLFFNHVLFVEDFTHVKHTMEGGMYICRVYRYFKDIRVTEHHSMPLKKGFIDFIFGLTNVYHLGWVRSKEKLLNKLLWTIKRELYYNTPNQIKVLSGKSDKEIMEWIVANLGDRLQPVTEKKFTGIYEYCGKYPEILIEYMSDRVSRENKRD